MGIKCKRVLVTWNDAHGDPMQQVWTAADLTEHKPVVVQTIGYLYKQDEIGVTLFQELIEDETVSFRGKTFIPTGMIVKIETLNISRPKKQKGGE